MSKKFNKFETLCEKAYSHHANGGFRTNTPVKLRPEFFKSDFYQKTYQKDSAFDQWLRGLIEQNPETFFFIHDIAGNSNNANAKDANELVGSNHIILTLKTDPRSLYSPTEFNEFTVPGDYNLVEVLNFGINLPPVQGVPSRYERYDTAVQGKPVLADPDAFKKLGNHSVDNKLADKNTAIPASVAQTQRYANPTKKSFITTKWKSKANKKKS